MLNNLLESSSSINGKSLNALDFPRPNAVAPPQSIAADLNAWNLTLDIPWCKRSDPYPSSSTKWGLSALAGMHHLWHIDSNGFGTYIDMKVGSKWWVMARPKDGQSFDVFTHTSLFMDRLSGVRFLNLPNLVRT